VVVKNNELKIKMNQSDVARYSMETGAEQKLVCEEGVNDHDQKMVLELKWR
jgi:hypothetical protein